MKHIIDIFECYYKLLFEVAKLTIVVMVVVVTAQVTARIFGGSIDWSEEVARLALTAFAMFGFPVGVREGSHIYMEIIEKYLSPSVKRISDIIVCILVLGVGVVLCKYGYDLAWFMRTSRIPATGWSGSVWYIMVPFASISCVFYPIIDIMGIRIEGRTSRKEREQEGSETIAL